MAICVSNVHEIIMQKAIDTLTKRIERLNEAFDKAEKISDEPELLMDYEFALNDMANIELEIIELQSAINVLNDFKQNKLKAFCEHLNTYKGLEELRFDFMLIDFLATNKSKIDVCNHVKYTKTWEKDAGCYVCDNCNKRLTGVDG